MGMRPKGPQLPALVSPVPKALLVLSSKARHVPWAQLAPSLPGALTPLDLILAAGGFLEEKALDIQPCQSLPGEGMWAGPGEGSSQDIG